MAWSSSAGGQGGAGLTEGGEQQAGEETGGGGEGAVQAGHGPITSLPARPRSLPPCLMTSRHNKIIIITKLLSQSVAMGSRDVRVRTLTCAAMGIAPSPALRLESRAHRRRRLAREQRTGAEACPRHGLVRV